MYEIKYEHIKCRCGGVMGLYNRGKNLICTCSLCDTEMPLYEITYDDILINSQTGWIFPVRWKNKE
jgi:hypothetical protein